ncbi:MAG: T9SS type A sorting domain-containing protein [Bacteroides sp.]|nr:T9SS type A sorting domain-containing protein [Bacteroides sp.]
MKIFLISLMITLATIHVNANTDPDSTWFCGSWGVRLIVEGGVKLDNASSYSDWVKGAQEIVDSLPTVGHVFTNFTHRAHGYWFTLRDNPYVDIANEIHPEFVPSLENEQIIFDVIDVLKKGGKKVILYIATDGPSARSGTANNAVYKAAWEKYYNAKFDGDEGLAWRTLCRGFCERFRGLADGYWLDHGGGIPGTLEDFIAMIREVDPNVLIASNKVVENEIDIKDYFEDANGNFLQVDSDGTDDMDDTNYKIKSFNVDDSYTDFTAGHPTPLAYGAPPNSWAYEEYTFPEIVSAMANYDASQHTIKHAWMPMRMKWTDPKAKLMFNEEQAYRFVRTLTDGDCALTWGNTQTNGSISKDEIVVMKEIDRRLRMDPMPDYIPYTRPPGARLVGENIWYHDSLFAVLNPGNTWYHNYCTAEFYAPVLNTWEGSLSYSARIPSTGIYPSPVVSKFVQDVGTQAYIRFNTPEEEDITELTTAIFKVRVYTKSDSTPGNNSLQLVLRKDNLEATELALKKEITEYDKWVEYTFDMSGYTLKDEYYNNIYLSFTTTDPDTDTEANEYYIDAFQGPVRHFNVTFRIKELSTDSLLKNVSVIVDQLEQKTEANGETDFSLASRNYNIRIMHPDYADITSSLDVFKDTVIDISMSVQSKSVIFSLYSETTGNPLSNISVVVGDNELITGLNGAAIFDLYNGQYEYTLSHPDYFTSSSTLEVSKDTSIRVALVANKASVKFRVNSEGKPLYNALIQINDDLLATNQTGIALFKDLTRFEQYNWSVSKQGYAYLDGTLSTLNDTTVNVSLELQTNTQDHGFPGLSMYPNPAQSKLYFECDEIIKRVEISDLRGALLLSKEVNSNNAVFDIFSYENGIYIAKIYREGLRTISLKLIKSE